ncbi:hypothetical protein SteCoe_29541 [Stentor coeruleus]|uniref:Uncharacterized protein n=1 Tax=Stentor coeruleus TaxID=5963 RepID=A0A1R2B5Q4_9CILI|nr:hypothetical protein SteCoe_29541 [Stentor coeruleus]
MSIYMTPRENVAEDSSKIQQNIIDKLLEASPGELFGKSNFFDSLKQTNPEVMQRRLESRRHPMTGMSGPRSKTTPYRPSTIQREILRQSHKLNPRILETWLNNTVADAEDFEIPSSVLKQDTKLPLARFGIDRSSLLNAGLPSIEVDKLYQSLFVHSIGFYQLILKVLEHTEKKYTIVTGIWKVFAILLEYCCQLDYQMIITTLNLEKREELEQLENEYKGQISLMEEHEKRLLESINNVRNQLKGVQKDLQKEIEKREELEDELLQRGSGHEEEVAMRLLFESKLNQMYAKQRDMTTKIEQLTEVVNDQAKLLETKTDMIAKEKKRANDMIQGKIETEQEMKKTEERLKQYEVINTNLESRLDESLNKIDELSTNLSKAHMELSECLNEIAQKRILIDDQKFEIDVGKVQIVKLDSLIKEYAVEKQMYLSRIMDLQKTYAEEFDKNKHFEQECARLKESEAVAMSEYHRFKKKADDLEEEKENIEKERDSYKVSLDSLTQLSNELKSQVKRSQERMEEMNKGRRIVEELNENLKARLDERIQDLTEARKNINDQKAEIENLKSREVELEGDVASLQIKLRSLEKQFETTKETLQEKINNLNDILTSEKKIRENWIYRYEEEQKLHAKTTKDLISTEDRLNDMIMKNNSLTTTLEEKTGLLEKYVLKNKEQLEEILSLKSLEEEFLRKNKTLSILIGSIEAENKEKISEILVEVDDMKSDHMRDMERKNLLFEELWYVARFNLEIYEGKCKELADMTSQYNGKCEELVAANLVIEKKNEYIAGKCMIIEELEAFIIVQADEIMNKIEEFENLRLQHYELNREYQDWLNKIPQDLKHEKNPFSILEERIFQLKDEINNIISSKENTKDIETQYNYEPDVKDALQQTEVDSVEFEKLTKRPQPKVIEKAEIGVQSSLVELPKVPSFTLQNEMNKDFPLRKKMNSVDMDKPESRKTIRQQSAESAPRDEEVVTPVNLKSIYRHEEESEEAKHLTTKLPSIAKKIPSQPVPQVRPPTMPSMLTSDIKRHIKQANSRRKNDSIFN